ncbi:hypothetical protein [Chitinophaga rhizosphaerae]|uniref:hypothetical protein n=1 Tax=Chitinophaga rhizosphaerae TaxID=1864947 RepID=UPI000F810B1D|nr:hypothetical protein [Chitinophaga rhizosphaerae]
MKKGLLQVSLFLLLLQLISCGNEFTGSTFASTSGSLYVKFLDGNTLEWKRRYKYRAEEYSYVVEGDKIRVTRKSFGQVHYIRIIDPKTLEIDNGTQYYLK